MRRPVKLFVLVSMALMITTGAAMGQNANTKPGPTFKAKQGPMVKGKAGPMVKVGQDLSVLWDDYQAYQRQRGKGVVGKPFKHRNKLLRTIDDRVVIDAVATGDPSVLQAELEALGMQKASRFGRMVSGELPMDMIGYVAALDSLRFARPAYAVTRVGSVDSQGDAAMLSDEARANFMIEGSGVTVGVLSDSFDCSGGGEAGDVASGDLPTGINVLDDSACPGTDEGRAMMQLIHDVAPGSDLAFHTAFNGQPDFASGIIELATVAGAQVIVDDVIYLAEPMFQDGIIAQAVDTAVGMGVSYFSSAGNDARASYESEFRPSGIFGAHDFHPGPPTDIFQKITVPVGSGFLLSFQWDSPFFSVSGAPGSPNDMDIAVVDVTGSICLICAFGIDANVGGDPVEVILFFNDGSVDVDGKPGPDTTFNILIEKYTPAGGPDPNLMKYVRFDLGPGVTIDEFATDSGTVYGHANAAGAEAVGAAFYLETPEFGTDPPLVEPYSSAGPTSILFDLFGAPIAPVMRDKPEIVAPDGVNNTLLGFDIPEDLDTYPNFFGTSAAAPHAAGVAALMLEANSSLTPNEVYAALESTSIDMNDPDTPGPDVGFDYATGYGLIQAHLAVEAALPASPGITVTPTSGLVTTEAGGTATFSVVLDTLPSADVTITLSSAEPTEGMVSPTSLIFTPANGTTPQTVTVTGIDDAVVDGDVGYTIVTAPMSSADTNYDGMDPADVTVTNMDDDTAGITVTPTSGLVTTEAGGTATFTVVLDTLPSANVTIALSSSSATEGMVSPASLSFTSLNGTTPQTVTVTGENDDLMDGDVGYTIVTSPAMSTDPNYNGINPADVTVTNTDDDTAVATEEVIVTRVRAGNSRVGRNYNIRATVRNESVTQNVAITVRATVVNNTDVMLSQELVRTVTIAAAGESNVKFNDSITLPAGNYTVTITVDEDSDVGPNNMATFRIR